MNLLLNANVSAIVDVVALAFIVVYALWGCLRGFVKTFFSAFGTIISFILAILLASAVTTFLQNKFSAVTAMSNSISGLLSNMFGDVMNATIEQATHENLAQAGLAGFIIDVILTVKAGGTMPTDTTLNNIICPTIAYYIVLLISAIALFAIFKIIFKLVSSYAKKMHKNKTFARVDAILGLVLGLLHGIIVLELIILGVKVIPIGFLQSIYLGVQNSVFAGFIERISLYNLLIGAVSQTNIVNIIASMIV